MGDTIQIDIAKLEAALGKLNSLVSNIDTRRRSATTNCPIALPSLSDDTLGQTSKWLTEQAPELQTRLDLAKLLDGDGNGKAEYKVEHGDQLWEVKRALSTEMTNQLKNLDIKDVGSRQRAMLLAEMLGRYQNDPDIPWQVMNALGPEGLTTVLNKLRTFTSKYNYPDLLDDPSAETQAQKALQDLMGKNLSGMFSSASTYMGADWGTKVAQDPWAATVLLKYIDQAKRDVDPTVFEAMGVELKNREHNDPLIWADMYGVEHLSFGNLDFGNRVNPMQAYLNVADNSTRAAQAVMGNKDLAGYFLSGRQDVDDLSNQAGNVLKVATVDAASSDNYQHAMKAADISSNVLFMLGDKDAKPLDGIKEEVGQIIGTYIMDAERTAGIPGEGGPGIHRGYINGKWPEPFTEADGFPRYGININSAILTNVLNDVGDNETAARTIGQATTMYNQGMFDKAAGMGDGPLVNTASRASTFAGFMQDGLLDGKILGADADVEARKKAAELFTLPLDFIPTDKVPVLGDYILGEVKDGITEAYAGDNSDAIIAANEKWGNTLTTTKLQAYYAMTESGKYGNVEVVQNWPTENGEPKRPDQLSREEINALLGPIEGMDQDASGNDIAFDIKREVNQSFDNLNNRPR